jgi:uncharacterized membrane protein YcaP (DUF421 family)
LEVGPVDLLNVILRGIGAYVLALVLSRIMGQKFIAQMTFFDFIVAVTMGSLVANVIMGTKSTTLNATVGIIVISAMAVLTAYLHIKSLTARKLVNSEPSILIHNGTIVEENMKKARMNINELMMKLREKNSFNLADVEFAIMETDGQISVMPKSDKQPLTPSDMNIKVKSTGLTKDIIIDGNIMEENLKDAGLDRKWLDLELQNQNIKDASEVFYAGVDGSGKLFISKKSNGSEEHGKYGIE